MLISLFEDKRLTAGVMVAWTAVVVALVLAFGLEEEHSKFVRFGPSNSTQMLGMSVDSWGKWWGAVVFCFVNTCMNEFIGNALDLWLVNTLQDPKCKEVPYSKATCILISQMYNIYCHGMGFFGLSLLFTQIDFVFARLAGDVLVSTFAFTRFVAPKTVSRSGDYGAVPEAEAVAVAEAGEKGPPVYEAAP